MVSYTPMMTNPSDLQIEQLSRADLIALVRALFAQVEPLKNEAVALREEIERLKGPKANSQNSSQPRSRDKKPKRKHGPPFGHKRSLRKLILDLMGQETADIWLSVAHSFGSFARLTLLALTIKKSNCKALDAFDRNPI